MARVLLWIIGEIGTFLFFWFCFLWLSGWIELHVLPIIIGFVLMVVVGMVEIRKKGG